MRKVDNGAFERPPLEWPNVLTIFTRHQQPFISFNLTERPKRGERQTKKSNDSKS